MGMRGFFRILDLFVKGRFSLHDHELIGGPTNVACTRTLYIQTTFIFSSEAGGLCLAKLLSNTKSKMTIE